MLHAKPPRLKTARAAIALVSGHATFPETPHLTPAVLALLVANIGMFLLQGVMPGFANTLVFVPRLLLVHPWSIVTYMFLHGGLMHVGFNMLALYFFGPRVEERIGTPRFVLLYFLSGISGAAASFAFTPQAAVIGASAGVFGVMMAFAHYWPHAPIYIWGILPIPARILVILTTVFALWSGFAGGGGNVAHFAHLGGFAGAYLYLLWIDRASRRFRKKALSPLRPASSKPLGAPAEHPLDWKRVDLSAVHEVNREQLNAILDKISAHGLDALTPEERLFLSNFVPMDDRLPPVS